MKDCHDDSRSPIIARSNKKKSGSISATVNVGSQVSARHAPLRNKLDRWPILGIDQGLVAQPLGNGLLADRRTIHELGDTFSKGGLAAGDLDGTAQRGNVVFLHNRREYTTKVVRVNNLKCVPVSSETCTVTAMGVTARKRPAKVEPQEKEAIRDTEGRTLGDRLKIGMAAKARMLGRAYVAKDLLEDASLAVGRGSDDPPVVSQQALSKIMTNRSSYSEATPAFAQVLGLNALWLAYGVGPRCIADTIE
jgi:hypothetical protein